VPKMGATSFGYEIAKKFGHSVVPTRAALVPLIFAADDLVRYKDLSGVALPVRVECGRQSFSNAMLFTHRGISGPAILQISSYWKPGDEISVNFLPLTDADEWQ
jgi:predicted flavoprotein YhiN